MATKEQLLEIVSEYEAASPGDLQRVIHLHEEQGGSLAELLLQESLVDEEDLFFLMSRRLAVPAIPAERLRYLALSPEIRRRVPRSLARECVLVPLDLDVIHGRLSVAMFDPTDQSSLDKLRRVSRVAEIRAYLARRSAILAAVEAAYSDEDDALAEEAREDLPLLGRSTSQVEANAPTQVDQENGLESKVEIDPSMEMEIQAFEGGYAQVEPLPPIEHSDHLALEEEGSEDYAQVELHLREVRGRSLLHEDPTPADAGLPPEEEEDLTQPFMVLPEAEDETGPPTDEEMALGPELEMEAEERLEHEITQVRLRRGLVAEDTRTRDPMDATPVEIVGDVPPFPKVARPDEVDPLMGELLSSVGILVSMLEERIDPSAGTYKEFGRLCRIVAREAGLDELAVTRISLAAHLYGLDTALKREVGTYTPVDPGMVFGNQPAVPGGLGPSLRSLGARALGLADEGTEVEPIGVRVIRLVADFLELRAEEEADLDTVVQLLRTRGDGRLVDALARALATAETPRVFTEGGGND
jgi:hypothetical protein